MTLLHAGDPRMCAALCWQRLGRSPYAIKTNVAMQLKGYSHWLVIECVARHKWLSSLQNLRFLLRYPPSNDSKRGAMLGVRSLSNGAKHRLIRSTPALLSIAGAGSPELLAASVFYGVCKQSEIRHLARIAYREGYTPLRSVDTHLQSIRQPECKLLPSKDSHLPNGIGTARQTWGQPENSLQEASPPLGTYVSFRAPNSIEKIDSHRDQLPGTPASLTVGSYRPSLAGLERRAA